MDDRHFLIDITWYRGISDADERDLCRALQSAAVLRHLEKIRTLILRVKIPNLPVSEENV